MDVRTVARRRRLLPLALLFALPLSCADSGSTHRCPFGVCTTPAPADSSITSPSAALIAELQSQSGRPAFLNFGLLFGDKLAANSIAVVDGLAACDESAAVSGVVLDRRDGGDLDVSIDTAMACWATATSESPLATVLVTVTLPVGTDEQLLMITTASAGDDLNLLPEVGATWAVGYSWQYSSNDDTR